MKPLYILAGLAGLYLILQRQQAAAANVAFTQSTAPQPIAAQAPVSQGEALGIQGLNAIPVVGQALSSIAGAVANLNKPYGTCAPNAPDSNTFLSCWSHAIPNGQIPYWKGQPTSKQPGTAGWDFAWCGEATGGRVGSAGCNKVRPSSGVGSPSVYARGLSCDCSSAPCVCAPQGAVMGLKDGTFVDASGRNLGPAVAQTYLASTTSLVGSL